VHSYGKHAARFLQKDIRERTGRDILETRIGRISIVEMTGAIARRIVPYVSEDSHSERVRNSASSGSVRVDLFLPPSAVRIVVKKGQKLRAGTTCIAEVSDGGVE